MTNKNKQQKLISEFLPKHNSQQTLSTTNSVNVEEKSNEIILLFESEIIQLRKRISSTSLRRKLSARLA